MTTVQVAIPWRDSGDAHRRAAWDWIRAGWAVRHPGWEVVTGDSGDATFNIPASLNEAIAGTSADVLVVTGADAQVSIDGLKRAVAAVVDGAQWVMACDAMLRLPRDVSEDAVAKMPVGSTLPQLGIRRACDLGWGVLVGRREVFTSTTYDETLHVAWEDSAWGHAAATLHGEPYRLARTSVRLLWHPRVRRVRQEGYGEAQVRMLQYAEAHRVGDEQRVRRLLAEGLRGR